MRKEKTEMAVEIFCKQADMDIYGKIRAIEHVDDVTLIQYNGEYHAKKKSDTLSDHHSDNCIGSRSGNVLAKQKKNNKTI